MPFRKYMRKLKSILLGQTVNGPFDLAETAGELGKLMLSSSLENNLAQLKDIYFHCDDVIMRAEIGSQRLAALLVYVEGFVDKNRVGEIMNALMLQSRLTEPDRK